MEIARATVEDGGLTCSKRDLGVMLGCSQRMVDNGMTRLREAGYVIALTRFAESGGQLASEYRATDSGLVRAFRLLAKAKVDSIQDGRDAASA